MSGKVNLKNSVAILVFFMLLGGTAGAGRTIYVDDDSFADFKNIQTAIDDANNGDTVVVKDGIYAGDGNRDIDYKGKAITVRSENGPANCIIDCQGSATEQHRAFYFHNDETPDSVLDGFTITNANHDHGAILCDSWDGSSPTITNCIILNNHGRYGGGIFTLWQSTPIISDCIIASNSSDYQGGGLHCSGAVVSNCIISGNRAGEGGGGGIMNSDNYGIMTITNCTITANEADWPGAGGMWIHNRITPTIITNCILWGNDPKWPSASQIHVTVSPAPFVTYCDVEAGWPGVGNIDADPLFVDADGPDNVIGTKDDDLHLLGSSPCLDAGDNSAVPDSMVNDVQGNPRIVNGTVDMGAYEGPNQGLVVTPQSVTLGEGQTATFTVALGTEPVGSVEVTSAVTSGDTDIAVASGATLTFDAFNYAVSQTVTLVASEDEDFENGSALVTVTAPDFNPVAVRITESENDHTLYVDAKTLGANKGTSWADAFDNLQDALGAAAANPHITEIKVAQGTYKPDQGTSQTPGDRQASFQLVNGVTLRGGYAGWGEPDPNDRNIAQYETILSGDLAGDDAVVADPCDLLDEPSRSENSYHVVKGFDFPDCHHEISAVLDGCTITGGNANGPISGSDYHAAGGGLLHQYVRGPKIANCTFHSNSAESGGAIFGLNAPIVECVITKNAAWNGGGLSYCTGLIKGCTMQDNYAEHDGGAVYLWEGNPRIENCTIRNNTAANGGGIFLADAEPILVDCTFSDNSAVEGGGMCCEMFDNPSWPVLIACAFVGNTATSNGGGIYSYHSYPKLTACLLSGNSAELGGGMANFGGSTANLTNCTFAGNSASNGNAVACQSHDPQHPWPSDLQLTNCILWNGGDEVSNNDGSTIKITHSDVWAGWPGPGNIETDPCFADPDNGDYHLKSQAGRWNPSNQTWVQDDITSPCIDAGDMASPIGYEPFPHGGIVNMGAYGGTAEASKSYFGEPVCETIVAGDINGDCKVDFLDFAFISFHWLDDHSLNAPF